MANRDLDDFARDDILYVRVLNDLKLYTD